MYKSHNPHLRQTQGFDIAEICLPLRILLSSTAVSPAHPMVSYASLIRTIKWTSERHSQRKLCVVIESELMLHLESYKKHSVATAALPERVNSEI